MSTPKHGRVLLTLLLVLGMVALTGSQAQAQPPNDDFDNAIVIPGLPFADSQDTTNATTAPDDPDCVGMGHTVWYAFTPGTHQTITANTFGSDYDTTLSAYTGTRGSLNQVACNDDFQSLQSKISFQATAGVTYFLMVGSFDESPGGNMSLSVNELLPAPNDDFDNATVITDLPFTDNVDTSAATTAPDDPDCFGMGHTVWYSLTPGDDIIVEANTGGSDYDTTVSAYTGTRGSLNQVGCIHGFRLRFNAAAGTTYFIMVGSFDDTPGGELVLTVREIPPRLVLGVTIDPNGTVTPAGVATIHGRVTCSRDALGISMWGTLTQRKGKRVATGTFSATLDCTGGSVPWSASVVGETGTYRRGDAQARVGLNYFDPEREEVVVAGATQTVRLS
jgi:hypothetical protein